MPASPSLWLTSSIAKRRCRVVVRDRAGAIRIADRRADSVAQVNRERFVVFIGGIAVDQDRDLFGRFVGREVQTSPVLAHW